jgi:hypothetical protein
MTQESVKATCGCGTTAAVEVLGHIHAKTTFDRTRPSPGPAAVRFGGGSEQDQARLNTGQTSEVERSARAAKYRPSPISLEPAAGIAY